VLFLPISDPKTKTECPINRVRGQCFVVEGRCRVGEDLSIVLPRATWGNGDKYWKILLSLIVLERPRAG